MCQYLGDDGEILQLGLSVGGSEERQVVEEVGCSTILGFRDLTHPRWVIGSGLGRGKVGGVGRGGVGEHVEEESCRDWTEAPDKGVHHHYLFCLCPCLPQIAQPHHLVTKPSAPNAAPHPLL